MAHQVHNIPWSSLTSNLQWSPASHETHDIADFHPQGKPNQANDISYFIKKFSETIEVHSKLERSKYPAVYEPPGDDEVIISDATKAEILPTVRRWRKGAPEGSNFDCNGDFCCKLDGDPPCCPILPLHERRMSAFCRYYRYGECYEFYKGQSPGFFNMELVKTLILHGDMEPLLRACARPDVTMKEWHVVDQCGCCDFELGWDQIYQRALISYIGFNVIYSFPETWDVASRKDRTHDYRDSRLYQMLISYFIGHWETPVREWRRRFGHSAEEYYDRNKTREAFYGRISYNEFLCLEALDKAKPQYDPDIGDIVEVRSILRAQGLPTELVLDIMEFAEYSPKRGVKVPHDPFHPDNRDRLMDYLNYCWKLLVRCDMLAKEPGIARKIKWEMLIAKCIDALWDSSDINRKEMILDKDQFHRGSYDSMNPTLED